MGGYKQAVKRKEKAEEEQLSTSPKPKIQSLSNPFQFQQNMPVTAQNALHLQRTIGNAALQRLAAQQSRGGDVQRLFGKKKSEAEVAEAKKDALDIKVGNAIGKIKWMNDPLALQALRVFALSEYSPENVDCQLMILEYRKQSTSETRKPIAQKIQGHFFGSSAIAEVNVAKKQTDEVAKKINENKLESTLFDDISNSVVVNLTDTLSRLQFSDAEAAQPFREYILQAAHEQTFAFKANKAIKKGFGAFTKGVAATMKTLGNVNPLMPF